MTHEEFCAAAGVEIDTAAFARLERLAAALLAANQRLNLVHVADEAELWRRHILDSLMPLRWLKLDKPKSVLDLGTGGGLPGLPLACVAEQWWVTLLDSVGKKARAVEEIAAAAGLTNARVVCTRAEQLAHDPQHRERYDFVFARAVARLPVLVEWAAGFLRSNREAWLYKAGPGVADERKDAAPALRRCGLHSVDAHPYQLPGDTSDRLLLIYRKAGALPAALPRRSGVK